jgi:hypothetical protein
MKTAFKRCYLVTSFLIFESLECCRNENLPAAPSVFCMPPKTKREIAAGRRRILSTELEPLNTYR